MVIKKNETLLLYIHTKKHLIQKEKIFKMLLDNYGNMNFQEITKINIFILF